MSQNELQRFIKTIETDHTLATGLKSQTNHHDIVEFAAGSGFNFTLSEWIRCCWMDQLQLPDSELESIWTTKTEHWSWAFRQIAAWRSLLMPGADQDSNIKDNSSLPTESSSQSKDQILEDFIALARQNSALQQQIREARNNTEILELANQNGFPFDSMTLLKKWSQHTDFSKPTWLGWFD